MEDQAQNLIDATTAAFKAGKLPGGAMVPPPMGMGGPPMGMPPPGTKLLHTNPLLVVHNQLNIKKGFHKQIQSCNRLKHIMVFLPPAWKA